jgi:hypothetical protein
VPTCSSFDSTLNADQNRFVRRFMAAAIVLALSASSASLVCAGWQASAAARMDCCRSAHDGCADQRAADACCARTEDGQKQLPLAPSVFPPPPSTAMSAPPDIFRLPEASLSAALELQRNQRRYPPSPPFLSLVLLI